MLNPHLDDGDVRLYLADCIDAMRELPADSVDAIVTDPPYGLEFMGKDWDRPWAVNAANGVGYAGRDDLKLPAHRDNRNPTCAECGGRARGKKRCSCDVPAWKPTGARRGDTRQPNDETFHRSGVGPFDRAKVRHGAAPSYGGNAASDMRAFQSWCEEWAREALRVAKPGAHLAAFGGTRTYHRLACAIEDAGWEVRDCLSWLYGSGFPKSLDVSKAIDKAAGAEREVVGERRGGAAMNVNGDNARPWHARQAERGGTYDVTAPATPDAEAWAGWGTALKPAWEPIILARKPLRGTVAANVLTHGTGALNIDGCRIEAEGRPGTTDQGRWPANVVLDPHAAALLDTQTGVTSSPSGPVKQGARRDGSGWDRPVNDRHDGTGVGYGDSGGASRFFYTAKADAEERVTPDGTRNTHPTVKPTDLMRWLVRLVTPPGGTVLDPFAGSGSTGVACRAEHVRAILIERDAEYARIIASRLAQLSLFSGGDS